MNLDVDLRHRALAYHGALPDRLRRYLNDRGIPDELIHRHLLGWNGTRITIPIPDKERRVFFFKLARDPEEETPGPKMYASFGSRLELYGWEVVLAKPQRIVICEGEFDRLVLEAQGFEAVTSTGGAGSFSAVWIEHFLAIPEVSICFDRDEAGRRGAERVGRFIPHARVVELPEDVGEGGDVTDFFVRLHCSREAFLHLLEQAQPVPPPLPAEPATPPRMFVRSSSGDRDRIDWIKRDIPIADFVGRYVVLRPSGKSLMGLCPFHDDHEPSLAVFPETRTFHCFSCRAGGDVISFLRFKEHLSFPEALDTLERLTPHHDSATQ